MEKIEVCPVELSVKLIEGKWKMMILYRLGTLGTKRFNELRRLFPEATPRTLTRQLRELEADGLIVRTIYAEIPPKVEYRLSSMGEKLLPLLSGLNEWGTAFMETDFYQRKHTASESH